MALRIDSINSGRSGSARHTAEVPSTLDPSTLDAALDGAWISWAPWAWWLTLAGLAALALGLSILLAGVVGAEQKPVPPATIPTVYLPPQ